MKNEETADLKKLAEVVIMQAVADLWSKAERKKSIAFFMSREFLRYAKMAEMKLHERSRLLNLIRLMLGEKPDDREQISAV